MLVSHPGLFHVERLPQGFSRAESLALIDWAGKRPGGSQRQPLGRSPPADTLWALRLTRSPPAADAWPCMQRDSSGMWATLRIDSPAPSALPAGVLPVVAGVLRLPGSLPLLRLLCRGVFGFVTSLFRPCRRLGRLSSRRGTRCCRRCDLDGSSEGLLPRHPARGCLRSP